MTTAIPFSRSETALTSVRRIYAAAYAQALHEYGNAAFADVQAWKAVGKAGFCQDPKTAEWKRYVPASKTPVR